MTPALLWIQHLPVFDSIAESDSVWAYPTVLMLHTVGLGWLVGLNTVVNPAAARRRQARAVCKLREVVSGDVVGLLVESGDRHHPVLP
jgi:hypothetical protein